MSSMKCPQCGLVNWVTAEACKRCKLPFVAPAPATATAAAPPDVNEQTTLASDEAHPPAAATDATAETAPGHAEPQQPFSEPRQQQPYLEPQQKPYLYDARAAQGHAGAAQARAS